MTSADAPTTTEAAPAARRWSWVRGIGPRGWLLIDVAAALAILVGLTTPVLLSDRSAGDAAVVIVAFAAAAALPVAVRRWWPVAALTLTVAATAGAELLGILFTPFASNLSPSVGLVMYTVATRRHRRFSLGALAAVAAVTFAATGIATFAHPEEDWNAIQLTAAVLGWLVGDAVRTRRHYQVDLATRRRREAEERTRRAIAEERLRISREVHDVISHNLSVIAVRSGVGRMLFDSQPEEARTALVDVENVSRNAIAELSRLLDSVRDRDSLAPTPQLRDIPDLVQQVRTASGIEVSFDQRGTPAQFHPTLELSAYRIVQEALTNVVKHAGQTRARVVVDCHDDALCVDVTNQPGTTRAPRPAGEGWGLVGIRERAALFGGTAQAGPEPDGGFRVSVRLPTAKPDRIVQ